MIKLLFEQRSEAWHNARAGRVTGTRFKDLMAGKTTAAYNNLIADLAAEILSDTDDEPETYENEWMVRGMELEPEARAMYSELKGVEVEQVGFVIPDEEHPLYEWVGVSPDGLVEGGMIEIKCPKRSTHLHYIASGVLPNEYQWQVHGQLFVTGLPWCDFFSYYPGLKPFIVRVNRDEELCSKIAGEMNTIIPKVRKVIEKYEGYEPR